MSKSAANAVVPTFLPVVSEKVPTLLSTLKDAAGGITRAPTLEEVLDALAGEDSWEPKPGHYYFSAVLRCFRRAWYEAKGAPCDHGIKIRQCVTCRFDSGKSEPGHATEQHIRKLFSQVLNYGRPDGPILNDVRFSVPVPVEWSYEATGKTGKLIVKTEKATVYIVGKSDTIILGDNFTVKQFEETKSPIFQFPAKARRLTEKWATKQLPLALVGITEPENPEGVVSITQVVQLAIGCKVLEMRGTPPEKAILRTVDRGNYRDHIEIVVEADEWNFLYDLAVWWVKEHHANLQFEEPPEPTWFSVYSSGSECKYCPLNDRCAKDNERLGMERVIHPIIPGISARIEALGVQGEHGGRTLPKLVQASLHKVEAANARKAAAEASQALKKAKVAVKSSVRKAAKARALAQHETARKGVAEPTDPLEFLIHKLGRRISEADLKEELEKFLEYGVSPENAVKSILRHHGVRGTRA